MNTGWLCPRCSASNSPTVSRCSCSPVQMAPAWPSWPYSDPWPHYTPWAYPTTRPYITWTTGSANGDLPAPGNYRVIDGEMFQLVPGVPEVDQ